MPCRSACPTQDHATYGECLRASGVQVGRIDATRQKTWDRELDAYRSARAQGVQPSGTGLAATRAALDLSDALGRPYDASTADGMGF